jgi:hypothetical protein
LATEDVDLQDGIARELNLILGDQYGTEHVAGLTASFDIPRFLKGFGFRQLSDKRKQKGKG